MEQIAAQMRAKKLPWLVDLRDESDFEHPVRLVLILRSNRVDVKSLMGHLFATTDLEKNYRLNFNIIDMNGRPRVFSLVEIISEWLTYRKETIVRRTEFKLDKILERLHLLDGFLIAYLNIDEVIAIIRTEDEPKPKLMERFNLSSAQAEAILELKLRFLARLEEMKLTAEREGLEEEREYLQGLLDDPAKLKRLMVKELKALQVEFGDARRSQVVEREEAKALKESDLMPVESVTVMISKLGWVRCAKGHDIDPESISYRSGDEYGTSSMGRSNEYALFFDSLGKCYSILANLLPSARGQGEPVTGKLKLDESAVIKDVVLTSEGKNVLVVSSFGFGFLGCANYMISKNRSGKQIVSLPKGSSLIRPEVIDKSGEELNHQVVLITNQGRCLVIALTEVPELNKGKGNKLINIPGQAATKEQVQHVHVLKTGDVLKIFSGKRHMTLSDADLEVYKGKRALRGTLLPRGFQTVNRCEVISV